MLPCVDSRFAPTLGNKGQALLATTKLGAFEKTENSVRCVNNITEHKIESRHSHHCNELAFMVCFEREMVSPP
jgi:hypothetical protein